MPARAVWRPPFYAWALLGVAGLAFVHEASPSHLEGHWLVVTPVALVLGVLAMRRLWEMPVAALMCGALVFTTFSGEWKEIGLGGLPLDRLAVIVALLAVLLRSPGVVGTPLLRIRNVHLLMAVTMLYVLGSAAAAGTLGNETALLTLIDELGLIPFLAFLVAPSVFAGPKERNILLVALVGLGAYIGLTAIFETIGPHSLVFPSYIARVDAALPEARAGGPFGSSVAEGFATFGCAVAAVIAFSQWQGRQRRLAAVVAIVCMLGCFLTQERGVWIAAVAASVIVALATRVGRRWLLPSATACALLIGGALLLSPSLASKVTGRIEYKPSVWSRQNQTSAGLRMIQAKPLFGFGWGRYQHDSTEYFRQSPEFPLIGYSTPEQPEPLHDSYLLYTVELGLVGALLWLCTLLWGVGGAIFARGQPELRPWKLGLLALLVFFLVVSLFNPYMQGFPMLLLWLWAGVAVGANPLRGRSPQAARRAGRLARLQTREAS